MRYSEASDIDAIEADARDADVSEFAALGVTVRQAMETGMRCGDWTATGLIDGVPVAMFGVAPADILAGIGVPWLVSTNAVARYERTFLRRCRGVVDAMLGSYPRLTNIVAEDNVQAKKWLAWLGFQFKDVTVQVNGAAFRQFRKGDF